jgi:hypothetical protein
MRGAGLDGLVMRRVWVQVTVAGTEYALDPSFKPQQTIPGIDLRAASGYSRSALLAAAGGTTTAHTVRGINEPALAATLTQYTANILDHLKQAAPHATPVEVVGGQRPVKQEITSLAQQFEHETWQSAETWNAIPESSMATLRIQLATIDTTLTLPALQGKKLARRSR